MQANRNIHLCYEKALILTSYPAAIHPKHSKLAVTGIREKPVDFINDTVRAAALAFTIISRIYARKKHPFTSYPAAKHTKHSKFAITDMRRKPVDFSYCTARVSTLVPLIILLI